MTVPTTLAPAARVRHKLSEEQSRRSYRAVVHILSPGADVAIDKPIRVHTLHIEYTERAEAGLVIKVAGHVILRNGRLSKTCIAVYVPSLIAPSWLQDIVSEYAPEWSPWHVADRSVES